MIHIDERNLQWVYSATALAALVLVLFLPSSASTIPKGSRRAYALLQVLTLLGAVIGAKVAFLSGDLGWPSAHVSFDEVVFSGRSITGGLLGGFVFAEAGKVVLRYRELPNDWFATKLPLSIAIGRVGCVFAGCCRGKPGSYPLALVYSDGIARFPSQLCELGFQVAAFALAFALFRRGALRGRLFASYMMSYGAFRFVLESLRDTPKLSSGFSAYQMFSVGLVACGALSFVWYSRAAGVARAEAPRTA